MSRALGMDHSTLSWVWGVDHKAGTYEREQLHHGDHAQEVRVGQMLWDENVLSVSARYPNDRKGNLPGPTGCTYQYPTGSERPTFHGFDAIQVLKACDCYEYQSCEHDGWPTSEAKAYIDSLRNHAWQALPGYDDARWGGAPTIEEARREYLKKQAECSAPSS